MQWEETISEKVATQSTTNGLTNGSSLKQKHNTNTKTKTTTAKEVQQKKYSKKQVDKMSRNKLEDLATQVFVKQNTARGLSLAEAIRRASLLMDGNTTPQLRKYIKKYGKDFLE